MLLGVLANIFQETRLVDPNKIYESMLHLSEWEFEKNAVALAGDDFKANTTTVKRLGTVATAMALLMTAQVVGLTVWAAKASNAAVTGYLTWFRGS